MAKLAAPNAEVLAAMEDLGLSGWMPTVRTRVRVRRDGAALRAERTASEIAFRREQAESTTASTAHNPVQAVQTVGLVLAAAGATALLVHGADAPGHAARSNRGSRAAGVLATAAFVGLGALATYAAQLFRGFGRR